MLRSMYSMKENCGERSEEGKSLDFCRPLKPFNQLHPEHFFLTFLWPFHPPSNTHHILDLATMTSASVNSNSDHVLSPDAHIPQEDEQQLIQESNAIKAEANQLFLAGSYDQAVSCYDRAISACPRSLEYEIAVLKSNVAACYLKLQDWKAADESATACIEHLDNIFSPDANGSDKDDEGKGKGTENGGGGDTVVEISGENEEEQLERLRELDKKKKDVLRIRTKALMRRARAKLELGGWANFQAAEEDYKVLASLQTLSADDMRVVTKSLRELPERINNAREQEMGEMLGKLKEVSVYPVSCTSRHSLIPY